MPDFIEGTYRGRYVRINISAQAFADEDEMNRRYRLEREKRECAETKSRALLTRLLTDSQRATLNYDGYIDVSAKSGRTYRVYCGGGREQNIYWIEDNQIRGAFCVAPGGDIPRFDAFLGQMLLIATDERTFFRVAEYSGRPPW